MAFKIRGEKYLRKGLFKAFAKKSLKVQPLRHKDTKMHRTYKITCKKEKRLLIFLGVNSSLAYIVLKLISFLSALVAERLQNSIRNWSQANYQTRFKPIIKLFPKIKIKVQHRSQVIIFKGT